MATYLTLDQVVYVYEKACDSLEDRQKLRKCFKSQEFANALTAAGVSFGVTPSTAKACLLVEYAKLDCLHSLFQGVTETLLPDSTSFPPHMLAAEYQHVEQLVIADHAAYKAALKRVRNHNQAVAREYQHQSAKTALDHAIHIAFSSKRHVFVSMDIEWWEEDSDYLLELGWSTWDNNTKTLSSKHWVVEEHINIRNGKYVPNKKWCFNFGSSTQGSLREGLSALEHDLLYGGLEERELNGQEVVVVLVGHGVDGDLKLLRENDIKAVSKLRVLETQQLFWALQAIDDNQQIGLKDMLKWLGLKFSNLHNAGNDARYTMEAFLAILEKYATAGNPALEQATL